MDQSLLRICAKRLSDVRADVLSIHPFFGKLLMKLNFGFDDCGTAYTDMKNIVFDPSFISKLNDNELEFVLMHELMHCVLKHCTRGGGKLAFVYNIACDIVVNSLIMEALGISELKIGNADVIHLAPDRNEGREYNAEEVYQMLMNSSLDQLQQEYGSSLFDSHEEWGEITSDTTLEAIWNSYVTKACEQAGSTTGISDGIMRIVKQITNVDRIDWRQILRDHIQYDRADYNYSIPDRRFPGDVIYPSFTENMYGSKAEEIWFAVDTSGSITNEALSVSMAEIRDAVEQIGTLCGSISFFDCTVSTPIPFENVDDVEKIRPVGGGGTSFAAVFKYMKEHFKDEPPRAVIILTDGYAKFPPESAAMGVDTVWLIVNSKVDAPWGEVIHIRL